MEILDFSQKEPEVKYKIKLEIDRLIDDAVGWDDDYWNGYRFALERVIEFISKM